MKEFRNIIFDLGGVILNIDYTRTIEAFKRLGIPDAGFIYSKTPQVTLFDDFEKGNISDDAFYNGIRTIGNIRASDTEIRDAWNSILVGLPEENVRLLMSLKNKHRLFLLSNTNSIHERAYRRMITEQYGSFVLDDLFEKIYLSHHLHMRKPELEIFNHVLTHSDLRSAETCFIDDSLQQVEGATKAGITSFLLDKISITRFFSEKYGVLA